jgi:hypothetical protein
VIWTIDLTPYRSFIDRDLKVSRTHKAKWRNREKIWAVGSGESMKDQYPLDMVKLQGRYDSRGPLDQEDTWRKIVMSLTESQRNGV